MLKLPEPLPYDAVDELINETLVFETYQWIDPETKEEWSVPVAYYLDGHRVSNYRRQMAEVLDDIGYLVHKEEDEDGYVDGSSVSGMCWIAEWSDEDTENKLNQIFGNVELVDA